MCQIHQIVVKTLVSKKNIAEKDLRHSFTRNKTLLMTMAICVGNRKENNWHFEKCQNLRSNVVGTHVLIARTSVWPPPFVLPILHGQALFHSFPYSTPLQSSLSCPIVCNHILQWGLPLDVMRPVMLWSLKQIGNPLFPNCHKYFFIVHGRTCLEMGKKMA